MKHKILSVAVGMLASADLYGSTVLVDEVPGGTTGVVPPPSAHLRFFDEARPAGWVGLYGLFNGETYINSDLFTNSPETTSLISWDFGATGFQLRYIYVYGFDANGVGWSDVYHVRYNHFDHSAFVSITINDQVSINSIGFWGFAPSDSVPDSGSTLILLLIGLAPLLHLETTTKNNENHHKHTNQGR